MQERPAPQPLTEIEEPGNLPTPHVPPPLPDQCSSASDMLRVSGPPPVVDIPKGELTAALSHIHQTQPARPGHGTRDSASWIGSMILHGLLIGLLALLLAPADFGGLQTHLLYLSFSDRQEDDLAKFQVATQTQEQPEETPEEIPVQPIPVDPAPSADSSGSDQGQASSGEAAGNEQAAPRGSFFGIAAEGHEFVYVLDMSGSMEGRRFRRATGELIRSVSGLTEQQRFYVLLFSGSTVQMFDQKSYTPSSVQATAENKAKLAQWLTEAYRGGSTDPRGALKIALRMKPSAVFMLSDGEFDDQKSRRKQKSEGIMGGGTDTFSVVAAAGKQVPVHSVAFEDPLSCANMKRLAEMTGGQYRFSEKRSALAAESILSQAKAALQRGDKGAAELLMEETIATYGETESGWIARKELGKLLLDNARQAMKNNQFQAARQSFLEVVGMDPEGVVTGQVQQSLVQHLLKAAADPSKESEATQILKAISDQYPNSNVAKVVHEPIAAALLKSAEKVMAANDPARAIRSLEQIEKKYPHTAAGQSARLQREQLVIALKATLQETRKRHGDIAFAKRLRKDAQLLKGTDVGKTIDEQLQGLALEMICRARDAGLNRQIKEKNLINQQIREAFGGDKVVTLVSRQLSQHELKARELLREGIRMERFARSDAVKQYRNIIHSFGNTISAKKAQDRIQTLSPTVAAAEGAEQMTELLELTQ